MAWSVGWSDSMEGWARRTVSTRREAEVLAAAAPLGAEPEISTAGVALASHLLAMADDFGVDLGGHPEWEEICNEARDLLRIDSPA